MSNYFLGASFVILVVDLTKLSSFENIGEQMGSW